MLWVSFIQSSTYLLAMLWVSFIQSSTYVLAMLWVLFIQSSTYKVQNSTYFGTHSTLHSLFYKYQ